MPIWVGVSETSVPIHFAILTEQEVVVPLRHGDFSLLNILTSLISAPLMMTSLTVQLGLRWMGSSRCRHFSPKGGLFTGAAGHYTATAPEHFQNYVLLTNDQFYMAEFEVYARTTVRSH